MAYYCRCSVIFYVSYIQSSSSKQRSEYRNINLPRSVYLNTRNQVKNQDYSENEYIYIYTVSDKNWHLLICLYVYRLFNRV